MASRAPPAAATTAMITPLNIFRTGNRPPAGDHSRRILKDCQHFRLTPSGPRPSIFHAQFHPRAGRAKDASSRVRHSGCIGVWCRLGLPREHPRAGEREHRRPGAGLDGRGDARRDRRSVEPGADRAGAKRGHRRPGRYAIIDLRPGTYTVTFTLPGFRTVRREGIVLEGAFAAQVNADPAGRRARGDGHGHGRVAGRRPAEHAESVRRSTAEVLDVAAGRAHDAGRREPRARA